MAMSEKHITSPQKLYIKKEDVTTWEYNGHVHPQTCILTIRRTYKPTKADKMLLNAHTAEETKKALLAGANPNAEKEIGLHPDSRYPYAEYFVTPLMLAETAEQTRLLIEAGADVNLGREVHAINERGYTALMFAKNEEQARLLLNAGAYPEDLSKNKYLSEKDRRVLMEEFKRQQQIELQRGHLHERQEYLAERKGEKVSSPTEPTTHDSSSPTPSKPNGRDDGGR